MDNHIQIPKFLIKNFASTDGKVFEYSLVDGIVYKRSPKKIGVEADYYCTEIEAALNNVVETKFASTINELVSEVKREKPLILSRLRRESIATFIFINFLRSNKTLVDTTEQLLTKDLSNDNETHNHIMSIGLYNAEHQILPFKIENFNIEIVINESTIPFITSRHGCCEIPPNKPTKTFYPISPNLALIVTILKTTCDIDASIYPWFIDDKQALKLNHLMFEAERVYNNDFIISHCKEHLLKAINA